MITIIPLSSTASKQEVGNKAWNLMQLHKAFFPVLDGCVVPCSAFYDWMKNHRKQNTFNNEIRGKLKEMIKWLGLVYPLIARSSTNLEDSPNTSWAGIFTTVHNITDFDMLIDAIAQIYKKSVDPSGRVLSYRNKLQVPIENLGIAVLIQNQITPDISGILFTRHPVTGEREYVIEYVQGVPWDLVSGKADNERIILPYDGNIPEKWRNLIKTGFQIEKYFSNPQDIEWAIKDGELFIFQARAIRSLKIDKKEEMIKHTKKELALDGTPASLGIYQGKTKFIYDDIPIDEAKRIMELGDVVVTMVLFPEYFPVLSKAGAIVSQQDSINCHVAILARELEIPCVVGVNIKKLSRCARDGDLITVNGSEGKVYIPLPRCPETIVEEMKELWGFEKSERYQRQQDILDKLIIFTKNDESLALKKAIAGAYELLYEIAPNDVDRAKSLYHDLSVFMQDIFIEILREKYPQEAILKAFSKIDQGYTPSNSIERLYFVIKNYINKHSSLKYKGKSFWEL